MIAQPSSALHRARVIAVVTTLLSFVVGVELVEGHGRGYRLVGLDLLAVVAFAVVGAIVGRGAAGPMRGWLARLCVIQSLCWVWLVASRSGAPGFGLAIGALPVLGYGLAQLALSRGRNSTRDGDECMRQ